MHVEIKHTISNIVAEMIIVIMIIARVPTISRPHLYKARFYTKKPNITSISLFSLSLSTKYNWVNDRPKPHEESKE